MLIFLNFQILHNDFLIFHNLFQILHLTILKLYLSRTIYKRRFLQKLRTGTFEIKPPGVIIWKFYILRV